MKTSDELVILHLSLINDIGSAIYKKIIEKNNNFDFQQLYNFSIAQLQKELYLSEVTAIKIFDGLKDFDLLEKELKLIERNNVNWSTVISDDYPQLLKNIHLPPLVLYSKGAAINDEDKKIAIVGSREANDYGKRIIDNLTKGLIENDWVIVSGGAIGADTMAHEAAIQNNGKTIVVLGSGLLKPYPTSNLRLFEKILQNGGTIVSHFPLNTPAFSQNFPQRNRIISGLSKGCIVVQATEKSGTRITALQALEQGREVFAIPGRFDDELSVGCHKLIQEGAKLITNLNDILIEFGQKDIKSQLNINDEINNTLESKILKISITPIAIDQLQEQLNCDLNELQNLLFQLQLEGKVKLDFTGCWQTI